MGLDMYLTGERYLWSLPGNEDKNISKTIGLMFPELNHSLNSDGFTVKSVRCEIMYWRKANAIHNWFVENCQDGVDECQETFVSCEKLAELKDICDRVLKDNSLASELLPARSGFFFGNTTYDDWYIRTLENTSKTFSLFLNNPDFQHWDFYYRASW